MSYHAMAKRTWGRASSLAVMATVYVLAAGVGWVAFHALPWFGDSRWRLFVADLLATLVVFIGSVLTDNTSMYDAYWSLAPPLLVLQMMAVGSPGVPQPRRLAVLVLVSAWGLRLTWNFVRGWSGLHHEDWRFVDIRAQTGRGYWAASLVALHLIPTAIVFLGCLALWPALVTSTTALCGWDLLALLVGVGAVLLETVADQQLRAFRLDPANKGRAITRGLWRTSRHPNYLGEIGFWWSLALFGYSASRAPWVFAGAAVIWAMFVFATIPLAEKHARSRRADYGERMARTRMLLPWPPRRRAG